MPAQSLPERPLRVIACGGTFDKHYDELAGQLGFADSHLPAALRQARVHPPYALSILPLQDSLDMQDADRQRVLDACQAASENALVIVHGTDTMTATASILESGLSSKTVVLTGAMRPFEVSDSDAMFNLGYACAAAQTLPAGVYVAMNGRIFVASDVRKNREAGRFETSTGQ